MLPIVPALHSFVCPLSPTTMPRLILPALLILLVLSASCGDRLTERLRTEGIATEASIAFKRESGNGPGRTYSFTLYFFTKAADSVPGGKSQVGGMGEFTSAELVVDRTIFDAHEAGEYVKIRYLPENPAQVILDAPR
jgi:hypothetical protein